MGSKHRLGVRGIIGLMIPALLLASTAAEAAKKKGTAAPAGKSAAPNNNPLDIDADAPLPGQPAQPARAGAAPLATQPAESPTMSNTTWEDPSAKPAPAAEAAHQENASDEARPCLFDISAGVGFVNRNFDYSNNMGAPADRTRPDTTIYHLMPKYSLPFGPQVLVAGQVYPAARISTGILGNLGVAVSLGYPILGDSKLPNGKEYSTKSIDFLIGARIRFRLSKLELQGGLDYGIHEFGIEGQDPPSYAYPGIPKVSYRVVRPSLSARYPIGEFISLLGGVGFRGVLGAGQIVSKTYFRAAHTSEWGFDANAGAGLLLFPSLEVRALVGLTLYSYSMKSGFDQAQDNFRVGGASDLYLTGGITIAYSR